jgi:hypothetical protein
MAVRYEGFERLDLISSFKDVVTMIQSTNRFFFSLFPVSCRRSNRNKRGALRTIRLPSQKHDRTCWN